MLSFTLLGEVSLFKEGQPLSEFRSQKEAALLIYLAHSGQTHPRESIADLLWDSNSTKQALSNLRTALTRLRKQVDDELVITRKSLALAPESRQQVDSVILLKTLGKGGQIESAEKARSVQSALESYQGDFLAGFHLRDAPQFDEWVTTTREYIRQQVVAAYDRLGRYALSANDVEFGIVTARRWLDVDALDEKAHILLVRLLIDAGNVREALSHYDACSNLLRAELSIEPPEELTALIHSTRPSQPLAPSPQLPHPTRHNLPIEYDQFFGREIPQQEIHARLDQPYCRLVTILGQGGIGKTRLATTIARSRLENYQDRYRDGVWLVELADIDPEDEDLTEAIAVEIATALDLRLSGTEKPVAQVLSHLQHKAMLLVLDNFEHVLEGVDFVLELIQQCEHVQLLVTSREALGIRAEWTIALTGLGYPASDLAGDMLNDTIEDLIGAAKDDATDDTAIDEPPSEAVELFAARRAQQQWQEPTVDDQQTIRQICRLVEGLPLAIELAAALTRDATVREIADQLGDATSYQPPHTNGRGHGFDALTTSMRDMPTRHRSLQIVFEMSWRTLTSGLQKRLARLSIFRGGFTEDAAQAIADADGQHLSALCEKSLVTHNEAQDRYSLHPVIRAYAEERDDNSDQTPQQHAQFYLSLLAEHSKPLQKDAPQESVNLLEPDMANVRLAWQTGLDPLPASPYQGEERNVRRRDNSPLPYQGRVREGSFADLLYDALTSLSIYYQLRGLAREGESVMQTTLTTAQAWGTGGIGLATRAGLEQARFQIRLGRYQPAMETVEAALKMADKCADRWAEGMGHVLWGEALWRTGGYELAEMKFSHALKIANDIHSMMLIGWCHHHLGVIHDIQSRYAAAHDHLEKACAAWQTIECAQALAGSLNSIGLVCYRQGDLPAAQHAMEQALALCNQLDNRYQQSVLLNNLSMLSTEQCDYERAHDYLQLGLELAITSGNLTSKGEIYNNLSRNYLRLGKIDLAVKSLEQGLHISELIENRSLTANMMINLADTKRELGDLKRAKSLYIHALEIAQQDDLHHTACEALIGMAELLGDSDRSQAEQYRSEAVTLAKTLQNPRLFERANAIDLYLGSFVNVNKNRSL
ncbi:MAG: tetratricopeptide repeat protein [Chloroflexota bacterium]